MDKTMNLKIEKVWFDTDTIFIQTTNGTQKSHPLRWFDRLWNAIGHSGSPHFDENGVWGIER